jgi:hypothetical protein
MSKKLQIWNTGYQRGRPRIGEVRPPSPAAIKRKEWLTKKLRENPEYRLVLAERQRRWRERNLERSRAIFRRSQRRTVVAKELNYTVKLLPVWSDSRREFSK